MAALVAHTIAGIPDGTPPTVPMIKGLEADLYAVARSMPSTQGGGMLGTVGAIMPSAQYLAESCGFPSVAFPYPCLSLSWWSG